MRLKCPVSSKNGKCPECSNTYIAGFSGKTVPARASITALRFKCPWQGTTLGMTFFAQAIEIFSSRELFSYVRKFWLGQSELHANENDTSHSSNEHYPSGQGCTLSFTTAKPR
jgi:hypothetical protein